MCTPGSSSSCRARAENSSVACAHVLVARRRWRRERRWRLSGGVRPCHAPVAAPAGGGRWGRVGEGLLCAKGECMEDSPPAQEPRGAALPLCVRVVTHVRVSSVGVAACRGGEGETREFGRGLAPLPCPGLGSQQSRRRRRCRERRGSGEAEPACVASWGRRRPSRVSWRRVARDACTAVPGFVHTIGGCESAGVPCCDGGARRHTTSQWAVGGVCCGRGAARTLRRAGQCGRGRWAARERREEGLDLWRSGARGPKFEVNVHIPPT